MAFTGVRRCSQRHGSTPDEIDAGKVNEAEPQGVEATRSSNAGRTPLLDHVQDASLSLLDGMTEI
jgi:hypothetical protein